MLIDKLFPRKFVTIFMILLVSFSSKAQTSQIGVHEGDIFTFIILDAFNFDEDPYNFRRNPYINTEIIITINNVSEIENGFVEINFQSIADNRDLIIEVGPEEFISTTNWDQIRIELELKYTAQEVEAVTNNNTISNTTLTFDWKITDTISEFRHEFFSNMSKSLDHFFYYTEKYGDFRFDKRTGVMLYGFQRELGASGLNSDDASLDFNRASELIRNGYSLESNELDDRKEDSGIIKSVKFIPLISFSIIVMLLIFTGKLRSKNRIK